MNDLRHRIIGRKEKSRIRYGQPGRKCIINGFNCGHCHAFVSTESDMCGVQNRNHCPYCLWSRHLDLSAPGDRLSACKALMQPIGLTIKLTRKKYGTGQGELMLIHTCRECKTLSINRIAADDDPQIVFAVGEHSCRIEGATLDHLEDFGIRLLGEADHSLIRVQLFGDETSLAGNLFYESIIETG